MKKINKWASGLILFSIIEFVLFNWLIPCNLYSSDSLCSMGVFFLTIWIGIPLILIGIILFIVGLFVKSKKVGNKK